MDQSSREARELVAHLGAFRRAVVRGAEAVKVVQQAVNIVRAQLQLEIEFSPEVPPAARDYLVFGAVGALEGGVGGAVLGAFLGGLFGDVRTGALLGAGLGAALGGTLGVNKVKVGWRIGIQSSPDGQRVITVERVR
jgi:hypothetical protein